MKCIICILVWLASFGGIWFLLQYRLISLAMPRKSKPASFSRWE